MPVQPSSDLLRFLIENGFSPGQRLPSIGELARRLGISTGKLREQLEVARELGLVEVRPKTGMRIKAYSFAPVLRTSLSYALALDPANFLRFGKLRDHLEGAFWHEAVRCLQAQDIQHLQELVERAWRKLRGDPVQIPHQEHRDLHLTIYSRLDNVFVRGLLEAYWEAYEAVGLDLYADYTYLHQVWVFHERMVEAIVQGNLDAGFRAFLEHVELIRVRRDLEGARRREATEGEPAGAPDVNQGVRRE